MNIEKRAVFFLTLFLCALALFTGCATPGAEQTAAPPAPAPLSQAELEMMIENLIEEGVIVKTYHMGAEAHLVVADPFYNAGPNVQKNYAKLALDYWKTFTPATQWVFLEDGPEDEAIGSYSASFGLTLDIPKKVRDRLQ